MRVKEFDRLARNRPNKVAKGMQYTWERSKAQRKRGSLSDEATTLCVRGTLDTLAMGLWLFVKRTPCPCCGSKTGPRVLSDRGRAKLQRVRRRRDIKRARVQHL